MKRDCKSAGRTDNECLQCFCVGEWVNRLDDTDFLSARFSNRFAPFVVADPPSDIFDIFGLNSACHSVTFVVMLYVVHPIVFVLDFQCVLSIYCPLVCISRRYGLSVIPSHRCLLLFYCLLIVFLLQTNSVLAVLNAGSHLIFSSPFLFFLVCSLLAFFSYIGFFFTVLRLP